MHSILQRAALALVLSALSFTRLAAAGTPALQAPLAAVAQAGPALVALGDHGVVLRQRPGGAWAPARQVPVDTLLTAACFANAQDGWAVGHGGAILSTRDGGDTWTLRHRVEQAPVLLAVACLGPQRVLVTGAYGTALESRDAGQTWRPLAIGQGRDADLHLNAVVAGPDGTLLVAAEGGAAFRQAGDGAAWERVDTQASGSLWGGLRLRDGTLLLYGMGGRIVASRDGGRHWHRLDSGTRESLAGATQLEDGRVVLVGNGGVLVASHGGGLDFAAQVRPDRQNLAAVAPRPGPEGGLWVFGAAGVAGQAAP